MSGTNKALSIAATVFIIVVIIFQQTFLPNTRNYKEDEMRQLITPTELKYKISDGELYNIILNGEEYEVKTLVKGRMVLLESDEPIFTEDGILTIFGDEYKYERAKSDYKALLIQR